MHGTFHDITDDRIQTIRNPYWRVGDHGDYASEERMVHMVRKLFDEHKQAQTGLSHRTLDSSIPDIIAVDGGDMRKTTLHVLHIAAAILDGIDDANETKTAIVFEYVEEVRQKHFKEQDSATAKKIIASAIKSKGEIYNFSKGAQAEALAYFKSVVHLMEEALEAHGGLPAGQGERLAIFGAFLGQAPFSICRKAFRRESVYISFEQLWLLRGDMLARDEWRTFFIRLVLFRTEEAFQLLISSGGERVAAEQRRLTNWSESALSRERPSLYQAFPDVCLEPSEHELSVHEVWRLAPVYAKKQSQTRVAKKRGPMSKAGTLAWSDDDLESTESAEEDFATSQAESVQSSVAAGR